MRIKADFLLNTKALKKCWVIGALVVSNYSFADTATRFVHVLCSPNLGYFEISALQLSDVFNTDDDAMRAKSMLEKYSLYAGDIKKTCDLGGKKITFNIIYDPVNERRMCGEAEPGHLTLFIDDKKVVDNIDFNAYECSSIDAVKVDYMQVSGELNILGLVHNNPMLLEKGMYAGEYGMWFKLTRNPYFDVNTGVLTNKDIYNEVKIMQEKTKK